MTATSPVRAVMIFAMSAFTVTAIRILMTLVHKMRSLQRCATTEKGRPCFGAYSGSERCPCANMDRSGQIERLTMRMPTRRGSGQKGT